MIGTKTNGTLPAIYIDAFALVLYLLVLGSYYSIAFHDSLALILIFLGVTGVSLEALSAFFQVSARRFRGVVAGTGVFFFPGAVFLSFLAACRPHPDMFTLITPGGIDFPSLFFFLCIMLCLVFVFFMFSRSIHTSIRKSREEPWKWAGAFAGGALSAVGFHAATFDTLGGGGAFLVCVSCSVLGRALVNTRRMYMARIIAYGALIALFIAQPEGLWPEPALRNRNDVETLHGHAREPLERWWRSGHLFTVEHVAGDVAGIPGFQAPALEFREDGERIIRFHHFSLPPLETCMLDRHIASVPFWIHPAKSLLLIRPASDIPLRAALLHRVPEIVVNMFPESWDVFAGDYSHFADDILYSPEVVPENGDVRQFLRKEPHTFDIIFVGSSRHSGCLSFTEISRREEMRFTLEAIEAYLEKLSSDGVLVLSGASFSPPRELLRFVTTCIAALTRTGDVQAGNHFIVIQQETSGIVMVKKAGWSVKEVATLSWFDRNDESVSILYAPGTTVKNAFSNYFRSWERKEEHIFFQEYPFDVWPVRDMRPYFRNFYKWRLLPFQAFAAGFGGGAGANRPVENLALFIVISIYIFFLPLVYFAPLYKLSSAERFDRAVRLGINPLLAAVAVSWISMAAPIFVHIAESISGIDITLALGGLLSPAAILLSHRKNIFRGAHTIFPDDFMIFRWGWSVFWTTIPLASGIGFIIARYLELPVLPAAGLLILFLVFKRIPGTKQASGFY